MANSKIIGKIILITLSIVLLVYIYKTLFEENKLDHYQLEYNKNNHLLRKLLSKIQTDGICQDISIKNLAVGIDTNIYQYLNDQTEILNYTIYSSYFDVINTNSIVIY